MLAGGPAATLFCHRGTDGTAIILYNVPGRTGVNLLPATAARLAEHPRLAAIKEASGNISQIAGAVPP